MKPSDSFVVQLADETGQPIRLSDVSISVDLFLDGKHRYGFRLGPTDEEGHLDVSYADVEEERLDNLKAQSWDYKTRLDECDPVVRFSVPTQAELDQAVKTATSFNLGVMPPDAEWWSRANNRKISCLPVDVVPADGVAVTIVCTQTA